jgi:hypothetical protein
VHGTRTAGCLHGPLPPNCSVTTPAQPLSFVSKLDIIFMLARGDTGVSALASPVSALGRRVPRVGVSKSGNTPRFFPDARFGTDCGPTVHAVRAPDRQCACDEPCAAHYSIGLAWRRRPEEQVVPNFGGESVVCASADER